MATSPNYGWLEPDNTDLVKNGALAIRTLGNAIDTTMATMTPKSIVDAKGDLITATAADTPARLGVGTNDFFLQAASGQATGLKWGGDYTAWTPTLSNITIGNGGVQARYVKIGKFVHGEIIITFGSTSSMGTSPSFTIPVTSFVGAYQGPCFVYLEDSGTSVSPGTGIFVSTGQIGFGAIGTAGSYANFGTINSTTPHTWATGDRIYCSFIYEAAV